MTTGNILLQIKADIQNAVNGINEIINRLGSLGGSLGNLINIQNNINNSTQNNTKNINDNSTSIKNNTKVINDSSTIINNRTTIINRDTKAQAENNREVGLSILAISSLSSTIQGFLTQFSDAFIRFDKEMRNVNSIAQVTEKQYESFINQVKELSLDPSVVDGPINLSKAMYQLVSSGFDASNALTIAGVASKSATAGLTTTETSVKALSSLMNAYNQKTLQDSIMFSDQLFRVVDKGVITFEQLANNLGNVSATASANKVSFKEVGAAFIELTRSGISASESETAITNLIRSFQKPSKEALKLVDEYNKKFKTSFDFSSVGLQTKGFQGILKDLFEMTKGSPDLISKIIPEARASKAALALLKNDMQGFYRAIGEMNTSAGATGRALSQQMLSADFDIKQIIKSFELLKIEVGELIFKSFMPLLKQTQLLIETFNVLDKETKQTLVNIGLFVGGIASLALGIKTLIFLGTPIISFFTSFSGLIIGAIGSVASFASSIQTLFLIFGASPSLALFTGITGAIGLAVASVFTLYKGVIKLKEYLDMLKAEGDATKAQAENHKILSDSLSKVTEHQRKLNEARKEGKTLKITAEEARQLAQGYTQLASNAGERGNKEAQARNRELALNYTGLYHHLKNQEDGLAKTRADKSKQEIENARKNFASLGSENDKAQKQKEQADNKYTDFRKKLTDEIQKHTIDSEKFELLEAQKRYDEELKLTRTIQDKKDLLDRFNFEQANIRVKYGLERLKDVHADELKLIKTKKDLKDLTEEEEAESNIIANQRYIQGLQDLLQHTSKSKDARKKIEKEINDYTLKLAQDSANLEKIRNDERLKFNERDVRNHKKDLNLKNQDYSLSLDKQKKDDDALRDYVFKNDKISTEVKKQLRTQDYEEFITLYGFERAEYLKFINDIEELDKEANSQKMALYEKSISAITSLFDILKNSSVKSLASIGDTFGQLSQNAQSLFYSFGKIQESVKVLSDSGITSIDDLTQSFNGNALSAEQLSASLSIVTLILQGGIQTVNFFATGFDNAYKAINNVNLSMEDFLNNNKQLIASTPFIGSSLSSLYDGLLKIFGIQEKINNQKIFADLEKGTKDYINENKRLTAEYYENKQEIARLDREKEIKEAFSTILLEGKALDDRLALIDKKYYKKLDELRQEEIKKTKEEIDKLIKQRDDYKAEIMKINQDLYHEQKNKIEANSQILIAPYQIAIKEIEKQLKTIDQYIDYINNKYDSDRKKAGEKSAREFAEARAKLTDNPQFFRQETASFEQQMQEKRANIEKSYQSGAYSEKERLDRLKEISVLEGAFYTRRTQETTDRKQRFDYEQKSNRAFSDYKDANLELLAIQKDEQVKQFETNKAEEQRKLEANKQIIDDLKTYEENSIKSLDLIYKDSADNWLNYMKISSDTWSNDLKAKISEITNQINNINAQISQKAHTAQPESIISSSQVIGSNPYLTKSKTETIDEQIARITREDAEAQRRKLGIQQTNVTPTQQTKNFGVGQITTQPVVIPESPRQQARQEPLGFFESVGQGVLDFGKSIGNFFGFHAKGGVSLPNKINIFGENGPEATFKYDDMKKMYNHLSNIPSQANVNKSSQVSVNVNFGNVSFNNQSDMKYFENMIDKKLNDVAHKISNSYSY